MFVSIFKCKEPVVRSEIALKTSTTGPSVLQTVSKLFRLCISNYFQETSSWITNYPRVCIANLNCAFPNVYKKPEVSELHTVSKLFNLCITKYTRNQLLEQLPPGSPPGNLCWVTVGQILLRTAVTALQIRTNTVTAVQIQRYNYGQIQCSEIYQDKYRTVNAYQMDDL